MLNPDRLWGEVTALAQKYEVSRKFLYALQAKGRSALEQVFEPQTPGPKPLSQGLVVDRALLHQAMVVLSTVVPGTLRGIQLALDLLFGQTRSLGYIQQTLHQAGATAALQNRRISVPLAVLGEADEIFQGRKPCLTLVDGRSFLVLRLAPEAHRDATTWGVHFLDVQAQGVRFQDVASDGARGILAGVKEAELSVPLRPDLFHLQREGGKLARRLETQAYRAIETAERAKRAEREAQAPTRRPGPPLKVRVPLGEALIQEEQAIEHYDLFVWLRQEVRQALEPFDANGRRTSVRQAEATITTAIELLMTLNISPAVNDFAQGLLKHQEELLAPLRWMEEALRPWSEALDATTEASILWAWRHRQSLNITISRDFPSSLHQVGTAYWDVLSLFHRSSSLAESLHSWLRPYLQVHRGMPDWLLALLQFFWNHHPFQRGKRQGNSPLKLAGVDDVPSLAEALKSLVEKPQAVT
jgi:hypothetical protein